MPTSSLLDSIVENLPLALFAKDPQQDFRYVLWNKMAEELWGLRQSDVLGRTDFELFPLPDAKFYRSTDIETVETKKMFYIDRERVDTESGHQRWIRVWKTPMNDSRGSAFLMGMCQDITEIIQSYQSKAAAEERLKEQHEKLAHASRLAALGEMAGGVAHEVNTPLGVISLHAEVALSQLEEREGQVDPAVMKRHLEKIQETAMRIAKIVQSMRSVARSARLTKSGWKLRFATRIRIFSRFGSSTAAAEFPRPSASACSTPFSRQKGRSTARAWGCRFRRVFCRPMTAISLSTRRTRTRPSLCGGRENGCRCGQAFLPFPSELA